MQTDCKPGQTKDQVRGPPYTLCATSTNTAGNPKACPPQGWLGRPQPLHQEWGFGVGWGVETNTQTGCATPAGSVVGVKEGISDRSAQYEF